MKNFKVLTIAALMAGASITFTSCGDGAATTESAKDVKLDNGLGYVKQLTLAVEGGDIKMDKATSKELAKYFDIEDKDSEYLYGDVKFEGYKLNRSFNMYDGVLNSVSYNTFYDDDKKEDADKDSKEVLTYLKEKLGKAASESETYYQWKKESYDISVNIFKDGYSFNVNSHTEKKYPEYESEEETTSDNCVGDFYGLKKDLVDKLMTNIKSGKIKVGTTTKAEIATLTGDGDAFNAEYDGLTVSGYYTYTADKLSNISLNYFYKCEGALSLLSVDKTDLADAIGAALGVTGKKNGTTEDAGTTWTVGKQSIQQTNFSDGYSIYIK